MNPDFLTFPINIDSRYHKCLRLEDCVKLPADAAARVVVVVEPSPAICVDDIEAVNPLHVHAHMQEDYSFSVSTRGHIFLLKFTCTSPKRAQDIHTCYVENWLRCRAASWVETSKDRHAAS